MKKILNVLMVLAGVVLSITSAVFGVSAMTADYSSVSMGENLNGSLSYEGARSAGLIRDEFLQKVTEIKPWATPTVTMLRDKTRVQGVKNRVINTMEYAQPQKQTTVTVAFTPNVTTPETQIPLQVAASDIVPINSTIIVVDTFGYTMASGYQTLSTTENLMLYVVDKDANKNPIVIAINGNIVNGQMTVPAIAANATIQIAGRAGTEKQMKTDAFSPVPGRKNVYTQRFLGMTSVTLDFIQSLKNAEWEFPDAYREMLFDLKRGEEISFWYGIQSRTDNVVNKYMEDAGEMYTCGGIKYQVGGTFSFGGVDVNANLLVDLMQQAFTTVAGSKEKIWFCGSDIIAALEKLEYTKFLTATETRVMFGTEVQGIKSKFGILYPVWSPAFDDMNDKSSGAIIDPNYAELMMHSFDTWTVDLRESAQSNEKVQIYHETCAPLLKNSWAHLWTTLD